MKFSHCSLVMVVLIILSVAFGVLAEETISSSAPETADQELLQPLPSIIDLGDQNTPARRHHAENQNKPASADAQVICWRQIGLLLAAIFALSALVAGWIFHLHRRITEANRNLREREETFRALSEGSQDVIMRLDRQGRYLYINPIVEKQTGIPAPEFIGKTFEELGFPADLCALWERTLREVVTAKAVRRVEFRLRTGVWIDCLVRPEFDPAGEVKAVIAAARDITERKQAEKERARLEGQLLQAMKMEAVGRLAGGVAHDFNNLLTSIIGNVQLALLDLHPGEPLAGTIGEIGKAADSAVSLTRQLLGFSRKQHIEPRVLDLNELIANLEKILIRLIGEDVALRVIPGKKLGAVKADQGQFEQILVNLAINARDAMPEGGRLLIETANIDLDEEYCRRHTQLQPGKYVVLAVSDSGQGMSEEVKRHLFEPFFTTKPIGQGTGLGLATIYGAVMQAGGAIEVYSEVGDGTTFKIYLPRLGEEAKRKETEAGALNMAAGKEAVLIVEDEELVRGLAIKALSRLGYRVLQAADGQQALAMAEHHEGRIDLLLTDVVMPGMNGKQLAERLRRTHPETKVIFTSGYTENTITHQGVIEPGLHFIGKPYTPQVLAKIVHEVLLDGKATDSSAYAGKENYRN
ncbi:MAG: response regulator [Myxococcales bacterium]|nr:response regulator [Myxococcales bacterium]